MYLLITEDNNIVSSMAHLTIIPRMRIEYQMIQENRLQETESRIQQALSKTTARCCNIYFVELYDNWFVSV